MSAPKKIGVLAALTLMCIPFVRFQSRFDVEVNWSIREAAPEDRTVTFRNLSFIVPAGQTVKQPVQLKGGGVAAVLYAVRGWGFAGQRPKVDGKEIPLDRIKTNDKRGMVRVLGIGRTEAMDAIIVM